LTVIWLSTEFIPFQNLCLAGKDRPVFAGRDVPLVHRSGLLDRQDGKYMALKNDVLKKWDSSHNL
jgi:hypothetical protein